MHLVYPVRMVSYIISQYACCLANTLVRAAAVIFLIKKGTYYSMSDLQELRCEIDRIDHQLVRLLEQRMDIARKIGEYKAENGLPVFDPERENEKIAAVRALAENPENGDAIEKLFHALMDASKDAEYKVK